MLVKMSGIHRVKKKLSNGAVVEYLYAYRGGPRLLSKPNTKAFAIEYAKATRHLADKFRPGTIASLIDAYQKSDWFTGLKLSTRRDYDYRLGLIRAEFGTMPLEAIEGRGVRRMFLEWLDGMKDTPRSADLTAAVFSRLLSFGMDREDILRHPLKSVERKSNSSRSDIIWPVETIKHLVANGKPHLVNVALVSLWTMQRQGDCLAMLPMAYDGERVRIRQMKRGALVWVRPAPAVKAILDAAKAKRQVRVLMNSQGDVWTSSGFRSSWQTEMKRLNITGLTFHDLRGSAITYAYAALIDTMSHDECIRLIAEISGHSEKEADAIIRRFYLAGDSVVQAIKRAIA